MTKAGIPVVPGTTEKITDETMALEIAGQIGFPLMIKPLPWWRKGMRLVRDYHELLPSFRTAKSEAMNAFGNDSVYIEKYIESPPYRIQILATNMET